VLHVTSMWFLVAIISISQPISRRNFIKRNSTLYILDTVTGSSKSLAVAESCP
jgi:hypothetical protein